MYLKLGVSDPQVITVQSMLNSLGFMYHDKKKDKDNEIIIMIPLAEDGEFGEKTEKTVMDFQKSQGLLVDGIVGPITMQALQDAYIRNSLETTAPTALGTPITIGRIPLVRLKADKHGGGYGALFLRSDAAEAYTTVYEKVKEVGGKLTSSGAMRELSVGGGANRSSVSFHYLGLAFDLYIYSGMCNIETDPYVITRDSSNSKQKRPYVRTWMRCTDESVPEIELTNVITYDKRSGTLPSIKGRFLDLTDLLNKNGFERIRPRLSFWKGTSKLAAEWWHFQFEKPLIPKQSTFGNELLRIYTRSQLENTAPWKQRDRIFKIDWF